MKKLSKTLIAGLIIAIVGVVVLLCALGASGWNLDKITKWNDEIFTTEAPIEKLNIEASVGKVFIIRGNTDETVVRYDFDDTFKPKFDETQDGVLSIKTGEKKWFNTNYWFKDAPTLEISVPQDCNPVIHVELNAGTVTFGDGEWGELIDVQINAGTVSFGDVRADKLKVDINAGSFNANKITCDEFSCDISAGSATVNKLNCDKIDVDVSAGSVNVTVVGQKSDYSISVDKSAGSCDVSNQTGTEPQKKITVKVSAGSVNINFSK